MSIWAVADIHASRTDPSTGLPSKPMDIFGPRWENHLERLQEAWRRRIAAADTVIVAGDIDWALHLEDARETLLMLDSLPGRKILLRGNHDYWWSSKTTNRVRSALPPSLAVLHNNSFKADGFNVCGTKGSPVPGGMDWTDQDTKLLNREEHRLRLSLETRDRTLPTVVALHYPPFYRAHDDSPFRTMIEKEGVAAVVYGHLHSDAAGAGPGGRINGVEYRLVAGDALGFAPLEIARDGRLLGGCVSAEPGAHGINPAGRTEGDTSGGATMNQRDLPLSDLKDLAEDEVSERQQEVGDEAQARELLDLPMESTEALAREPRED